VSMTTHHSVYIHLAQFCQLCSVAIHYKQHSKFHFGPHLGEHQLSHHKFQTKRDNSLEANQRLLGSGSGGAIHDFRATSIQNTTNIITCQRTQQHRWKNPARLPHKENPNNIETSRFSSAQLHSQFTDCILHKEELYDEHISPPY
jgi:hypothetical protein